MKILGISCFYHDSAAALVQNGVIIACAQEERFSRLKHDAAFPHQAIRYCLREAKLSLQEVDAVVFYEKPFLKFERILDTYLAYAPMGLVSFCKVMPLWIGEKLFQKKILQAHLEALDPTVRWRDKIFFSDHHLSHAASAFFPSPFEEAAVLTLDGVGEWATASWGIGQRNSLRIEKEIQFPHSLGLLYSAFTSFIGFKVNSGEYKLMGLAPYGRDLYSELIKSQLIDIKPDGSFRLNMDFFDYTKGFRMTNQKFSDLFGLSPRDAQDPLLQQHTDLAASIQQVTEEVILKLARSIRQETGQSRLCLAGGVALNCVANGKILESKIFDEIWIQPAAGDAGGALGAALAYHYSFSDSQRKVRSGDDQMKGSFLGPSFEQNVIESQLRDCGAVFEVLEETELLNRTAANLSAGQAIGWFQGRMEFGPRALGNRSILADPRSPQMQSVLNLKVKFRESFRPFAPAVKREHVSKWFEIETDSPYMLLVAEVKKEKQKPMTEHESTLFGIDKINLVRSEIPAVTHVDYSARIQTVDAETNPLFYKLIDRFEGLTGCPVLVNTSFNVRGEPIVCEPRDAFRCFMGTDIEVLVLGRCYLRKENQNPQLIRDYRDEFELD